MYDNFNQTDIILDSDSSDTLILRSSTDEDSEFEEGEDLESVEENNIDYSSSLDDVNSSLESLILQVDNLNDNVCIMNENLKFCVGLKCDKQF